MSLRKKRDKKSDRKRYGNLIKNLKKKTEDPKIHDLSALNKTIAKSDIEISQEPKKDDSSDA